MDKIVYRIITSDRKIKFAGTDRPSWFNLKAARELCDRTKGEKIYESNGVDLLWEVL